MCLVDVEPCAQLVPDLSNIAHFQYRIVRGAPRVVDNYLEIPEGPGLGIELDEEVIASQPYKPGFLNLWEEGWHKRQFTSLVG